MADLQEVLNEIDQKIPAQPVAKIKASDTNETLKAIAEFANEKSQEAVVEWSRIDW